MAVPSIEDPRLQAPLLQLLEAENFEQFWDATRAIFQAVLPEDTVTVYLNYFDFAKSWKASAIFATADAVKSAEWHERRRRVEVTAPFLTGHPGVRLYRLSDIFPSQEEFQSSPLYQTFMQPYGWQDSVGLVYRRGAVVNSVISLRRPACRGAYRPGELKLLRKLHPHFEAVISRLSKSHEQRARLDWFENFNDQLPFALLQLDWEMRTNYANREAMKQCCAWNFGPRETALYNPKTVFKIPQPILGACSALKQEWLGTSAASKASDGGPQFSARITHPEHPELRATIALQPNADARATRPVFAIWFSDRDDKANPGRSLSSLPAAGKLTAAERELASLIGSGCSNEEAATKLGKSRKTVAGQLTSIYKKLGVPGRSRLIAALR
ncbi:MAG TPA: helix-turn-helix transcriptional regulator [Opitutaceae bacterium]|nr:helix-turn-helix transcriptional regulator [Opitutaceae bacterium]